MTPTPESPRLIRLRARLFEAVPAHVPALARDAAWADALDRTARMALGCPTVDALVARAERGELAWDSERGWYVAERLPVEAVEAPPVQVVAVETVLGTARTCGTCEHWSQYPAHKTAGKCSQRIGLNTYEDSSCGMWQAREDQEAPAATAIGSLDHLWPRIRDVVVPDTRQGLEDFHRQAEEAPPAPAAPPEGAVVPQCQTCKRWDPATNVCAENGAVTTYETSCKHWARAIDWYPGVSIRVGKAKAAPADMAADIECLRAQLELEREARINAELRVHEQSAALASIAGLVNARRDATPDQIDTACADRLDELNDRVRAVEAKLVREREQHHAALMTEREARLTAEAAVREQADRDRASVRDALREIVAECAKVLKRETRAETQNESDQRLTAWAEHQLAEHAAKALEKGAKAAKPVPGTGPRSTDYPTAFED